MICPECVSFIPDYCFPTWPFGDFENIGDFDGVFAGGDLTSPLPAAGEGVSSLTFSERMSSPQCIDDFDGEGDGGSLYMVRSACTMTVSSGCSAGSLVMRLSVVALAR